MSIIELEHVWKRYGEKTVLENVELSVDQAEFVTIVGASGCGKTTFLKLLLGEEEADQGMIRLDGTPLVSEPSVERGVVYQRYSVFPHLTSLGNVLLGIECHKTRWLGRSFGRQRAKNMSVAQDMLKRVGLEHAIRSYPSELSGGMLQRLALAQTLVARPRILLLDEPFGALDPGIRSDMHELVRNLHQELELTIFMVTHDLPEGFGLGTRLLVLDKPRVDPHEPDLYGATITFDLPVGNSPKPDVIMNDINVEPPHREEISQAI